MRDYEAEIQEMVDRHHSELAWLVREMRAALSGVAPVEPFVSPDGLPFTRDAVVLIDEPTVTDSGTASVEYSVDGSPVFTPLGTWAPRLDASVPQFLVVGEEIPPHSVTTSTHGEPEGQPLSDYAQEMLGESSVTTPAKRKTAITDEFLERMRVKYPNMTGVEDEISAAVGHKSYLKWDDKQLYVQRWLARAFNRARAPTSRGHEDRAEVMLKEAARVEAERAASRKRREDDN